MREKEIAQKVIKQNVIPGCESLTETHCPRCNVLFLLKHGTTNYCGNCGQKLVWEGSNE